MDGILLLHAKTGHVLFSKAYTEGFGIKMDAVSESSSSDGAAAPAPAKDPLVASMLIANFICAFYTNVMSVVDESVLDSDDESIQALLRNPLQSFDTGSTGPLVFFRRHAPSNVLCALFLSRRLVVNEANDGSADGAFHSCGEWLAQQALDTFVSSFFAELGARPFRASTRAFRSFQQTIEEMYVNAFSQVLVNETLSRLAAQWKPTWMYAVHSETFLRSMEATQNVQAAAGGSERTVAHAPASTRVADAHSDNIVPTFTPHPPSHPAPSSSSTVSARVLFAPRPVSTRTRHPFRPAVRRWWHFGGGSKPAIPIFYQQLGRTVCFYSFKGEQGVSSQVNLREDASSEGAHPQPDAAALPSVDALQRLLALVHHAGALLSSPSEVADSLRSLEVQLTPGANTGKDMVAERIWVMRLHDLLLCFPTSADTSDVSSQAQSQQQCSFAELTAYLHPYLSCLGVHYLFVSTIHDRQQRALQKSLQKEAAAKAAR